MEDPKRTWDWTIQSDNCTISVRDAVRAKSMFLIPGRDNYDLYPPVQVSRVTTAVNTLRSELQHALRVQQDNRLAIDIKLPFRLVNVQAAGQFGYGSREQDSADYLNAVREEIAALSPLLSEFKVTVINLSVSSIEMLDVQAYERFIHFVLSQLPIDSGCRFKCSVDAFRMTNTQLSSLRFSGITDIELDATCSAQNEHEQLSRNHYLQLASLLSWCQTLCFHHTQLKIKVEQLGTDLTAIHKNSLTLANTLADSVQLADVKNRDHGFAQNVVDRTDAPDNELIAWQMARRFAAINALQQRGYVLIAPYQLSLSGENAKSPNSIPQQRIAVGVNGLTRLGRYYFKNPNTIAEYLDRAQQGGVTTQFLQILNEEDIERRRIIQEIFYDRRVPFFSPADERCTEQRRLTEKYQPEFLNVSRLEDQGLLTSDARGYQLTGLGLQCASEVAALFDRYLYTQHAINQ